MGLKPLTTLFLLFSRRFFWFSLVFFCIVGFPDGFYKTKKTFGKTKKKQKKTNPYPRVGLKPLTTLFFGFPEGFFVFFLVLFCIVGVLEGFLVL